MSETSAAPRMTLASLLAAIGLPVDAQAAATPVRGIALDTRELRPGDVFLALRGAQDHGYRHAAVAIVSGAVAVLAEAPLPGELTLPMLVPVHVAADLRQHVARLAALVYATAEGAPTAIGVTGTNGKTSTVQFIAAGAALLGRRAATQGTLGAGPYGRLAAGRRTTPDVCATHRFLADMRAAGCELVAMEVSSHALVQGRVDGVRFELAVYTQLSRDHLDYHGDMQRYFEAKARLFAWPGLRQAVINLDCPWGRQLAARTRVPTLGYSARGEAEAALAAEDIVLGHEGIAFTLRLHGERRRVRSSLLGRFNVDNLLAACGALAALGADLDALAGILPQLQAVPGRMNRLGGGAAPLVVVDYAHTPDAIEKALASLREHAPRRLIIVFGCGGERDRGKRPLMAAAAEAGADAVCLTDDNPRGEDGDRIVADALAGFARPQEVKIERDRERAIAAAIAAAGPGDIVLIAGKGHEACQEIGGKVLPFDDRAVAAACLVGRTA